MKRNWHQPTAVVMTRHLGGGCWGLTCDRTVAPFPLTDEGGSGFFDNNTDFGAPFPFASLTPTGLVKVTLTFKNPLVAGLNISVAVLDTANNLAVTGSFTAAGGETSTTITLAPNQGAVFGILNPPGRVEVDVSGNPGDFTTDGISSVCITFNQ